MTPTGSKEVIPEGQSVPNLRPANDYVFVSPRRLILQPDQLQYVRFMLRRNKDMPVGEYRSYVTIQPEDMPQAYTANDDKNGAAQAAAAKNAAAATMHVLAGYRIPLFFLNGETTLNVEFANMRVGPDAHGNNSLFFTVHRSGNRSAIGQAEIVCTMSDGKEVKLGHQRIQIFTELDHRDYTAAMMAPPAGCGNTALQFIPHSGDPLFQGADKPVVKTPL